MPSEGPEKAGEPVFPWEKAANPMSLETMGNHIPPRKGSEVFVESPKNLHE